MSRGDGWTGRTDPKLFVSNNRTMYVMFGFVVTIPLFFGGFVYDEGGQLNRRLCTNE